ncbi:HAD-IIA family hydrolase [Pseudalkalibacillus caeni]|uniref:Acid sugar phosphatase n=1 Tax=Exobacillus caeni TaxID=2574798 RepID=A0A5R9F4E5_9BACL|nr:HAD-IIA family hydrolase [Pseudalkalibacillus caeni]TLS37280.1 HAD-IIA family hydrolase [Pseudalkalibacillus caeni]
MKGIIFDLDGTVYRGEELIDGAAETVKRMKELGNKVVFLTNKPIATRKDYVEKLNKLGIEVQLEEVVNSGYLTGMYLSNVLKRDEKVLVIGEDALLEEIAPFNIPLTESEENAEYVLLSWDRDFTYKKLDKAFQAWKNGAKVIATNPDRTCPVKGGEVPDCGAIIGALEGATGEPIHAVIGKPSSFAANSIARDIFKLPPEQCYMIGDRLETDIRMAVENGLQSILVLTGVASKEEAESSKYQPDFILNSVADLDSVLVGS